MGARRCPLAVVRARSAEEVRPSCRRATPTACPWSPRGPAPACPAAPTPSTGASCSRWSGWTAILEIDPLERLAVVQPGVVNDDLRAAGAEHGLWYPPDPASAPWSTIGGNVATNAGGVCCVKYGVTRDYVLALEVVTGTGELVRLGRRTAKGVAGYDLVGLMVGSEGTLGIVTEVTVRLRPLPPPASTVVGYFARRRRRDAAVRRRRGGDHPLRARAGRPALPAGRRRLEEHGPRGDAEVLLLGRVDDPATAGEARPTRIVALLRVGRRDVGRAVDRRAEAEALFAARRLAYPALERLGPVLTEDVCVPKAAGAGDARAASRRSPTGTTS